MPFLCRGKHRRRRCRMDAPIQYPTNMTNEVGNLGLTLAEEEAIVAFLKTLTDSKLAQVK